MKPSPRRSPHEPVRVPRTTGRSPAGPHHRAPVLEDDKSLFPAYEPSLNVRKKVFDANPGPAELFAPISAALDTTTMTGLNVDVDGGEAADVAEDFLTEKGPIGG